MPSPVHPELASEDSDSIMTDDIDIDEAGIINHDEQEDIDLGIGTSTSHLHTASSSSLPTPSTSTSTATQTPRMRPSGPVCEFGERLAYTYFSKPVPTAAHLNSVHNQTNTFWLTVDDQLTYLSFFKDTGPLNVGCLYRFCLHLHELLESSTNAGKRIILFSADEPDKKANAALLMALYAMIVLRWTPADALHPIACLELQPFRDAGYARADFHLSCQDVLFGARRAIDHRLLKLDEFNVSEYEYYEKVENGDWNYITPNFLAFASPVEQGYESSTPGRNRTAASPGGGMQLKISRAFKNVLEYFEGNNVKMVVRLNKKLYDERRFTERGMEHREMYFDDGTNPTLDMCRDFIDLSERVIRNGGVVAVHCKAGLGRTGTLIGAYLIYKYGFSATEVIGFMRLMRPGTCVGPQQHFMYENQMTWVKWGAIDRYKAENAHLLSGALERPITPPTDDEGAVVPPHSSISTPRQVTPLPPPTTAMQVPGQPRKTPGAKLHHAYAAPETVDPVNDDVFLDQMQTQAAQKRVARARSKSAATATGSVREASATPSAAASSTLDKPDEEMLSVDDVLIIPLNQRKQHSMTEDSKPSKAELSEQENAAPTAYLATSEGIREITPPTVLDGNGNILVAPGSPGKSTATSASRSASRIGKLRPTRPLTSITDNRQVDKIASFVDNTNASSRVPRSKGVTTGLGNTTNNNSTFESNANNSSERYNLRAARSNNALSSKSNTASPPPSSTTPSLTARPSPHHSSASPSRLPVTTKGKRAGSKLGLGTASSAAISAPVTRSASGGRKTSATNHSTATANAAPVSASTRLARNSRKRRSSTGEV